MLDYVDNEFLVV